MLPTKNVKEIAQARLEDADTLLASGRYDGAVYLCGYAVELALKAKICQILDWQGYPSTKGEFTKYGSFKTHDLDVLLHLTGKEEYVKTFLFTEWSAVAFWNSEARYRAIGTAKASDAHSMISAAKQLLERLL